jgi:hypothetical protein
MYIYRSLSVGRDQDISASGPPLKPAKRSICERKAQLAIASLRQRNYYTDGGRSPGPTRSDYGRSVVE